MIKTAKTKSINKNSACKSENFLVFEVAIPIPLYKVFDYLPPIEKNAFSLKNIIGKRVIVSFGSKQLIGIIISQKKSSNIAKKKLKNITSLIDKDEPILEKKHIDLITWASTYYKSPIGIAINSAIPTWFRKGKEIPKYDTENIKKITDKIFKHHEKTTSIKKELSLTKEQELAVSKISKHLNNFHCFCLYGVTGSGKTEVYMKIIEKVIKDNKQALILIPEIGLTPQTLKRFRCYFNEKQNIVLMHSKISEKQKAIFWTMAKKGEAQIIIGTRSASLTQIKNLGIIIIDEEHDNSFKQQDNFRYSAKDFLIKRAKENNIPIILGSATPSLETLQNVKQNKFSILSLTKRVNTNYYPEIKLLDIRHKKLLEGISFELLDKIKKHLEKKGQIILFLNRRGYAPILYCNNCQFNAECKNCDSKMIVHLKKSLLICHHCDVKNKLINKCPKCNSSDLIPLGLGTERIEKIFKKHFPNANIARIDKDSMQRKNAMDKIIEKIEKKELDIIIGTQMISKGHHFANITLVGIIDIDAAFYSSDFRAMEKMGQLLIQVAGRAGRENNQAEVILQTTQIENPLLNTLLKKNYLDFSMLLLKERKNSLLPPFSYQILIRAESKKIDLSFNFLTWLKKQIQKENNLLIFGPITAPMIKKKNLYRTQLLLQATKRNIIHKAIYFILNTKDEEIRKNFNQIRWSIDVDPLDVY